MSTVEARLAHVLSEELASWPAGSAGVSVLGAGGQLLASAGEDGPFPWASVTKLLSALTLLRAAEAGVVGLDDVAGPPGATVRHLLSHASGISRDSEKVMAPPGTRRIYSNRGIELAAEHLEVRAGTPFEALLTAWVLEPLDMVDTRLDGSPAHGASGPLRDLARLASELIRPRTFTIGQLHAATRPAFPGLEGLLPGFGRQEPNDWGVGFEIRSHKSPHWTSPENAPTTFGHFGQSGSFLWVDPAAQLACVGLSDTHFGPWAVEAWPRLSTRVLEAMREGAQPASDRVVG